MDSKLLIMAEPLFLSPQREAPTWRPHLGCPHSSRGIPAVASVSGASRTFHLPKEKSNGRLRLRIVRRCSSTLMANSTPPKTGVYTVGDFMTKQENLIVVKPSTTVDEALESLVENKITGFPVVNDDWKLVGVVSDYDLLALDSLLGTTGLGDASMFPEVDSTWKVFNELQMLLNKTNGKLVADVMTQVPVVVRETTNLEDAARMLLETRYRRLPVVDADGKLVGIITRGNVIRAALQIKRAGERDAN